MRFVDFRGCSSRWQASRLGRSLVTRAGRFFCGMKSESHDRFEYKSFSSLSHRNLNGVSLSGFKLQCSALGQHLVICVHDLNEKINLRRDYIGELFSLETE